MIKYIKKVFEGSTVKSISIDILVDIIASIMIALGVYNFAVNLNLPLSGITGIAMIIQHFWNVQLGLTIMVLNIPLALLCYKLLGHRFFWNSIRTIIISNLFIDYVAPRFPTFLSNVDPAAITSGDYIIGAIASGVLSGIGYALIFTRRSSTGGVDFVNLSIKALKPNLQFGRILLINDLVVIVLVAVITGHPDKIIYGIIIAYLISICTDKLVSGMNRCKVALVITEKGIEFPKSIDSATGRGSTLIDVRGGYQLQDKQIVLVAVDKREVATLEAAIKKVDPKAFTILLDATEIHGEGFRVTKIAERKISEIEEISKS